MFPLLSAATQFGPAVLVDVPAERNPSPPRFAPAATMSGRGLTVGLTRCCWPAAPDRAPILSRTAGPPSPAYPLAGVLPPMTPVLLTVMEFELTALLIFPEASI